MRPIYRRQDDSRHCEYDFTAANVLTCLVHREHHILIGYLGPDRTVRTLAELREKGLLRGKALEMANDLSPPEQSVAERMRATGEECAE